MVASSAAKVSDRDGDGDDVHASEATAAPVKAASRFPASRMRIS